MTIRSTRSLHQNPVAEHRQQRGVVKSQRNVISCVAINKKVSAVALLVLVGLAVWGLYTLSRSRNQQAIEKLQYSEGGKDRLENVFVMPPTSNSQDIVIDITKGNWPVVCEVKLLPAGKIVYEPTLEAVVEQIFNTPPARAVLDEVLKEIPLAVIAGDASNAPMGGAWHVRRQTIYINTNENFKRRIGHLLFEICNAAQWRVQLPFGESAEQGLVSKGDYIQTWERIEFEAAKCFINAVQKCITKHRWSKDIAMNLPGLIDIKKGWERHWERIKNSKVHADTFGGDWEQTIRPLYCKRHPTADDCQ